jgi:isopentenyl-diphosphate delta-isomerase
MSAARTEQRKLDHIRICLEKEVEYKKTTGLEKIDLSHKALPEIDFEEIDLSTTFFGKKFKAPLIISAMTGGTPEARKINRNLAKAAQVVGIGMGLGSQRAMLENKKLAHTYHVRDVAPDIFLLGNIGATHLSRHSVDEIKSLVKSVKADGLAIHLNAAQELVQIEGHVNWRGVYNDIEKLTRSCKFPVFVKEVGCGISGHVARNLVNAGVKAIDVSGAGGTSWIKVDYYRSNKPMKDFFEWGIPTAHALKDVVRSVDVPIIASGGIRSGLDVAKTLILGASLAGMALPLLKPATESWQAVKEKLDQIIFELKTAMFLSGAKNIRELKKVKIISVC